MVHTCWTRKWQYLPSCWREHPFTFQVITGKGFILQLSFLKYFFCINYTIFSCFMHYFLLLCLVEFLLETLLLSFYLMFWYVLDIVFMVTLGATEQLKIITIYLKLISINFSRIQNLCSYISHPLHRYCYCHILHL